MAKEGLPQWGNAVPFGLSGFCIVCISIFLIYSLKLVPPEGMLMMAIVLIAATVALFTAGLITLRNGDTLFGSLLCTFGCMFTFGPGLAFGAWFGGIFPLPETFFGCLLILLGVWIAVQWGIPIAKMPIGIFLMIPFTAIELWFMGAAFIHPDVAWLGMATGIAFLVDGIWALYAMVLMLAPVMGIKVGVGRPLFGGG